MKKLIIAVICLISLFALGTGYIFFKTSGMVSSADSFFTNIKAGDTVTAASFVSEAFKASTSSEEFVLLSKQPIMKNFKEASWFSRSIAGNTGQLEGAIVTIDGESQPINLTMIKENELWRIYSIQTPSAGLMTLGSQFVPSNDKSVSLVRESIHEFGIAISQDNFTSFYAFISSVWRNQTTPEELSSVFRPFVEQAIDLSVLTNMSPIFDQPPKIDEDGILQISGHYATTPSTLRFEFGYIMEGMKWKLMKTEINISSDTQP